MSAMTKRINALTLEIMRRTERINEPFGRRTYDQWVKDKSYLQELRRQLRALVYRRSL